ncbi:MAG: hypothetical protein ACREJ0_17340 [Geminicoccaceae bacterium]
MPTKWQALPVARRIPAAAHHGKSRKINELPIAPGLGTALAWDFGQVAWKRPEIDSMREVA